MRGIDSIVLLQILYEEGANGDLEVTGLRLTQAGVERIVHADAYVAALDVPGEQAWLMHSPGL